MWLFCIIVFSSSSVLTHSSIFVIATNKISGNTMMTSRPWWKCWAVTKAPPLWTIQPFGYFCNVTYFFGSVSPSAFKPFSTLKWDSLLCSMKHITKVYSTYTINFVLKLLTYSSNKARCVCQDLFLLEPHLLVLVIFFSFYSLSKKSCVFFSIILLRTDIMGWLTSTWLILLRQTGTGPDDTTLSEIARTFSDLLL